MVNIIHCQQEGHRGLCQRMCGVCSGEAQPAGAGRAAAAFAYTPSAMGAVGAVEQWEQ